MLVAMRWRKEEGWLPLAVALGFAGLVIAACGSDADVADSPGSEGCEDSGDCASDERCQFPDGLCGSVEPGACVSKPNGCSTGAGPHPFVCGCDGAFHTSDCIDYDGVDSSSDVSICTVPPPGSFPCGASHCHLAFDYCLVSGEERSCANAGPGCSTCECIGDRICPGGSCSEEGGVATVTCPSAS
jgi:hypothetical protein